LQNLTEVNYPYLCTLHIIVLTACEYQARWHWCRECGKHNRHMETGRCWRWDFPRHWVCANAI